MIPSEPQKMTKPFANDGAKNDIPAEETAGTGQASLTNGFPTVTELPISQGGIPPQRKDFNGILYWLSAFCHFEQSGGIFSWSKDLAYNTPAFVFHNNELWVCVAINGKDTTPGVIEPGTNAQYWKRFRDFIGAPSSADVDGKIDSSHDIYIGSTAPPNTNYNLWFKV